MSDHPETDTTGGTSQGPGSNGAYAGANGASPFDKAKAAMRPFIDLFAEGDMDEPSLLAKANEVAAEHKVYTRDLRKWTQLEVGKLKRKPPKRPPEPDPGGIPDDPAELAAECAAAWGKCKDVATDPKLIERLLDAGRRLGIAGDKQGVLCAFLVMVSRLLKRPAAVLRKGAASSGKNFVTDTLTALLNPYDYIRLTSASAKALVYSPRDFRHRYLAIAEAAALVPNKNNNDEFAMMLRELLSSLRIIYATVERDEDGKLVGVEKEKEGPVAFALTTARENIEEELNTRILTTLTDESERQTGIIVSAVCDGFADNAPSPLTDEELAQWHALQDWLRLGCRDVVIPFAPVVGRLVERGMLRIRRDISGVLSLVQASALMHRAQRQLDEHGRIIADIRDYATAISALGDGLNEIKHGDTDKIEQVRQVVAEALRQAQSRWWWKTTVNRFTDALARHCGQHKLAAATQRIHDARQSAQGRKLLASIKGSISVATDSGRDPSLAATVAPATVNQLAGQLLRAAGKQAGQHSDKPTGVELSHQKLAEGLGIGRKAARVRLDNAIEAGAVLDVSFPYRTRTAPLSLAPGKVVSTSAGKRRRGAFPDADQVRQEWRKRGV
jgi:hypothetical protein